MRQSRLGPCSACRTGSFLTNRMKARSRSKSHPPPQLLRPRLSSNRRVLSASGRSKSRRQYRSLKCPRRPRCRRQPSRRSRLRPNRRSSSRIVRCSSTLRTRRRLLPLWRLRLAHRLLRPCRARAWLRARYRHGNLCCSPSWSATSDIPVPRNRVASRMWYTYG